MAYFSLWIKENYPKCQLKKKVLFFNKELKEKIKDRYNFDLQDSLGLKFHGTCNNKQTNVYITSQIVRTLNQTLGIEIVDDQIEDIKIISFQEPESYKASKKWLKSLKNKAQDNLEEVDAISGATLTRKSVLLSAKKSLIFNTIVTK